MSQEQQKASSEIENNTAADSKSSDCSEPGNPTSVQQSDEMSESPWDDRNPNWTEKDLPPQTSQESPAASADDSDSPWDDRNPNWTEKDLPPQTSQESPTASADDSDSPWDDRNPN